VSFRRRRSAQRWIVPLLAIVIGAAMLLALVRRGSIPPGNATGNEGGDNTPAHSVAQQGVTPSIRLPLLSTPTPEPPKSTPTVTPTSTITPTPTPSGPLRTGDEPVPQLGSQAVVLMDADSGAILYQYNAHDRREPASVTKIMTAIIAIERGDVHAVVKADYDPTPLTDQDSSMMWIDPGETVTLEDLLYGLMLPSGNDAAVLIAKHIAGSERAFVNLMNQKAQGLGMRDTHFENPHGLHAENHYTSAYDLAVLARYAMRNPTFRQIVAAGAWDVHADDRTWTVYNLNRLIRIYPDADGIKIGYNDQAGKTIVASVDHNGHHVYAVLLGSWNLWADTPALYDWAFRNYSWKATDAERGADLTLAPSGAGTPTP